MPGLVDEVGCGSTAVTKPFLHGNVVVTLPAEAPGIEERRRSNRAVARIPTSRSDTGGQEMELRHGGSNRSPRTLLVLAARLGAVLALSGCAGGGEGSSPEPMEPAAKEEAEPTSVVPVTTAQPPGTTSPPTTTEPSPQGAGTPAGAPALAPVYDANGLPQVNASPRRGGTGATIHVDGYGFTDAHWRDPEPSLWLAGGESGCQVYAEARHTVRVTPDGRLHGDFVVPALGACRQTGVSEFALQPGTYAIVYQCTACTIGTFEVTGKSSPPPAECTTVGFTPQSEDAASSILATGLSCEEAESFLRRLGPSVGTNGPPRIELDGFECVLTRHEPEPLPQGFYECTSGTRKITFVRS
jgi:hypothetical protein